MGLWRSIGQTELHMPVEHLVIMRSLLYIVLIRQNSLVKSWSLLMESLQFGREYGNSGILSASINFWVHQSTFVCVNQLFCWWGELPFCLSNHGLLWNHCCGWHLFHCFNPNSFLAFSLNHQFCVDPHVCPLIYFIVSFVWPPFLLANPHHVWWTILACQSTPCLMVNVC